MAPRVVVIGLASDFGCQVQMTNMEDHLLDVLGSIELSYWQLASSGHMPTEYDVAVIEGAVTTREHVETLERVRATASTVVVVGACAMSGGIPAIASGGDFERRAHVVYGDAAAVVADGRTSPLPVHAVIDVDYRVPGCPIRPEEFVSVLQRAVAGLSDRPPREPMCAACKIEQNVCFYERGAVCLGVVTRTGCGARCVTLGRPCTGCRGIAEDANIPAARELVAKVGLDAAAFSDAVSLYNTLSEVR